MTRRGGETLAKYVERRIHDIFLEIAEAETMEMPLEESTGMPMKLFQGETLLINVWRQYVARESQ